MDSSATAEFSLSAAPDAAIKAIEQVIQEQKHTLYETNQQEGTVRFITKKTMFSWDLHVLATVSQAPGGSHVSIWLDTNPNAPKALLDGKKNKKAVAKLADQIQAAA